MSAFRDIITVQNLRVLAGMIGKVQELMNIQGKAKEFAAYLADIRLRHKPKRNLMKLLEKY